MNKTNTFTKVIVAVHIPTEISKIKSGKQNHNKSV